MFEILDETTTGLMLLVHRLEQNGQPLGRASLLALAELKLPSVARQYDALVQGLLERNVITGDAEAFTLTALGERQVQQTAAHHSLVAWFYNEYYQATLHSPAHALFCERVYGLDLGQHGMADMAQLHVLLAELHLEPGQTLLDFGCGDGRISEWIADTAGLNVSGVDFAEGAIRQARERTSSKRDRLRFYWADLEAGRGTFPAGPFDRIVAIDSIFFCRNLRQVLEALLERLKPLGWLGIFYHCAPGLAAEETSLAGRLRDLAVGYEVLDFSAQNTRHWQLKKQVLLELEAQFRAEGNEFLYKNRIAECEGLERNQRYLYMVQK